MSEEKVDFATVTETINSAFLLHGLSKCLTVEQANSVLNKSSCDQLGKITIRKRPFYKLLQLTTIKGLYSIIMREK